MIPDQIRPSAFVNHDEKLNRQKQDQMNKVLPDLQLNNVNMSSKSDKDNKDNVNRPKHKFGEFILKDENGKKR